MQKWIKALRRNIAEQIQAIWDFTAGLTVTRNNIKNVSTAGIQIRNTTASDAVNTNQMSPYLSHECHAWKSGTPGDDKYEWMSQASGITGGVSVSSFNLGYKKNNGSLTNLHTLYSDSGYIGFNHVFTGPVSFSSNAVINGNLGIGAASAGEKLEVTGAVKSVYVSDTDSDTDDVLSTGITTKFGLVLIKETTGNKFCLYRIKGDNSIPIIVDGDAEFAAVKDNASTYNFYYETDQFKLQNKVGDNKALYVGLYLV